jgi:FKBP-type peptidyl-prolyl cis-trans isomerase (trigger factor)
MPQSVIDQESRLMARTMVQQIAARGATREQIEAQREVILTEATRSSHDRVKLRYILSRIAEEENIHCEDGELEKRIEAMAAQYGMSAGQLKSELEKRNGIESVKNDIRTDKTMDFLVASANVK